MPKTLILSLFLGLNCHQSLLGSDSEQITNKKSLCKRLSQNKLTDISSFCHKKVLNKPESSVLIAAGLIGVTAITPQICSLPFACGLIAGTCWKKCQTRKIKTS